MKGSYSPVLPSDVSPIIVEKLNKTPLDPASYFVFADDVLGVNDRFHYGLGISHVPVQEFIECSTPNGTMKKSLDWQLVDKRSELAPTLVKKISSTYAELNGNVGGIFVCSLFDKRNLVRHLHVNKLPYASKIERILFVARKEHIDKDTICRLYRYKQHVGDLLSWHLLLNGDELTYHSQGLKSYKVNK